jgi:glucose dehydrogenase
MNNTVRECDGAKVRRDNAARVRGFACLLVASVTVALAAQQQGLEPKDILKPLSDSWPTYSGDYSARRYSALKQINQTNVKNLSLAWTTASDSRARDGSRRTALRPRAAGGHRRRCRR